GVRARRLLCMREVRWSGAQLRFPFRQADPPATGGARADAEAPGDRPHRFADPLHLPETRWTTVQGVSCKEAGRYDRLRVPATARAAGAPASRSDGGQGAGTRAEVPVPAGAPAS